MIKTPYYTRRGNCYGSTYDWGRKTDKKELLTRYWNRCRKRKKVVAKSGIGRGFRVGRRRTKMGTSSIE